jgi:hypothetical protein
MSVERSDPLIQEILERLRLLEDERDILRTLYSYSHTHDDGRSADWLELFTEDGVFETRRPNGRRRAEGRAELARYREDIAGTYSGDFALKHVMTSPRITIEGDEAQVEAYFLVVNNAAPGGTPQLYSFGRYYDRLVRQDGRWAFQERIVSGECYLPDT